MREPRLDRPVAAEVVELEPECEAGHSLWLAPRTGWREAPTPGQFVMVWLPRPPASESSGSGTGTGPGTSKEALDNVPMSVAGWEPGRVKVTIAGVGPTTRGLLECREGEMLGLTGPLGCGFQWSPGQSLMLVAGGVGAPPLAYLAQRAAADGCQVHTLLGARSEKALFSGRVLERHSATLEVATDDGSAGHHGFVTELLDGTAETSDPELVCACGPEPMLRRVLDWAEERRPKPLPAQLCLERHMSCGIGVCGICTVDEWLVCADGPVLTGEQLRGSREFGK